MQDKKLGKCVSDYKYKQMLIEFLYTINLRALSDFVIICLGKGAGLNIRENII